MIRKNPHKELEKKIAYRFRKKALLTLALTHPSYAHESGDILAEHNNQRLEFLGDAALGLVSAAHLYREHPDQQEGNMTKVRSSIVNTRALADVARRMGLGEKMFLGKGESGSGGRQRDSNLADGLEAVIGAVFLDGGLKAVDKVFRTLFLVPEGSLEEVATGNAKGQLQERAQRELKLSPRYEIASETGPAHERVFEADVYFGDKHKGRGTGSSKRAAEMSAAEDAIKNTPEAGS
jgi:ribonuclease-3